MGIYTVVSTKRASDRDKIQCRLPYGMNRYDSPVISYGT